MPSHAAIRLFVLAAFLVARVYSCGEGESYTIAAGDSEYCCTSGSVAKVTSEVYGGMNDDPMKVRSSKTRLSSCPLPLKI